MHTVRDLATLEALFRQPGEPALAKELDHIDANYKALIAASPFFVLATAGPEGLDASPRGDPSGFVRVVDEKTLVLPERRGNNRIDSLRNIVRDPRVGLLFLIPGLGETLRVNGTAVLSTEPALLESFAVNGRAPSIAVAVTVAAVYFQCARAIIRSDLWNPAKHVDRGLLPTPGQILEECSQKRIDGQAYDTALPARQRETLY